MGRIGARVLKAGLWGLFLLALAWAQKITPQGIIVNPNPGDLEVQVWVDRDPSGTGQAVYAIGDPIYIYVRVNQDAYVYLFSINADGRIDPILPNPYERNNFLRAGETRRFPPDRASYRYTVTGPEGEDRVLAVASLRPLNLQQILDVERGQVRVQGAEGLARALSIVVEPLPPQDWVTDVARFTVVRAGLPPAPPPPALTTLVLDSRPQGAEVRVNGRVVGRTPLELQVNPGRKEVEFRLPGYQTYRATVNPRPGERVSVLAQLVPEVRTGTLSVDSNPRGAEVYVEGRFQGRTPLSLSLNEGRYRVEVRLPGYQAFTASVQVEGGRETRLTANLAPLTGQLSVDSNPRGAEVYLEGRLQGRTPLSLDLAPGSYQVRVSLPGYLDYQARVEIAPGQTQNLTVALVPARATLELSLNTEARVFLDGREVGLARGGYFRLEVPIGRYELTLVAPGYRTWVREVEITRNDTLRVSLEPLRR